MINKFCPWILEILQISVWLGPKYYVLLYIRQGSLHRQANHKSPLKNNNGVFTRQFTEPYISPDISFHNAIVSLAAQLLCFPSINRQLQITSQVGSQDVILASLLLYISHSFIFLRYYQQFLVTHSRWDPCWSCLAFQARWQLNTRWYHNDTSCPQICKRQSNRPLQHPTTL